MVWRQWGCGAWGRHRETVCAAALDEGAHEVRAVSRHVVRFSSGSIRPQASMGVTLTFALIAPFNTRLVCLVLQQIEIVGALIRMLCCQICHATTSQWKLQLPIFSVAILNGPEELDFSNEIPGTNEACRLISPTTQ